MPVNCKNCERAGNKKIHKLVKLPADVTSTVLFKRKGAPTVMCPYCDGDALAGALRAIQKRRRKPV